MTNERSWLEASEAFAVQIAAEQLDRIERDLTAHPKAHPDFTRAASALDAKMSELDSKADPALNALAECLLGYSAALAIEMYMYGVRDGGRIYHAFVTGELPKKGATPNEENNRKDAG